MHPPDVEPSAVDTVAPSGQDGAAGQNGTAAAGFGRSRAAFGAFAAALGEDSAAALARTRRVALIRARQWRRSLRRRAAARKARVAAERAAAIESGEDAVRSSDWQGRARAAASATLAAMGGGAAAVSRRVGAWRSRRRAASRPSRRRTFLRLAAAGAVAMVAVIAATAVWALHDVPWREIASGTLEPVVVLEAADGTPLLSQGPLRGPYAKRSDFPDTLVEAVIAIEDRRFYDHWGVDLRGISRALVRNLRAGEVVQGGSTITQQLIKILYLEQDRTLRRKLQEVVIALWLERTLGKDEILARYLNNVYLGAGATGMPAAARIYFDKSLNELDLAESAMLAGLIRSPSQLNPLTNPDGARDRAKLVLAAMTETGRIEPEEAATAGTRFAALHPTRAAERSGSWFADWVMAEAREIAGPFRGTISVRTTLSPQLQKIAESVVTEELAAGGADSGVNQAALVAMTPDGAVVAMVGGLDYKASEFNRAATARRQPGSTFKLFVYYAALKAGMKPNDRIRDEPVEIAGWTPENFDGDYRGRVSMAEAFARSLNAATVNLAMDVGLDKVVEAARELGIDAELAAQPSLALGTSEVTLIDLTGAYASVRAGAAPVEPWGIVSFQADGQPRSFRIGPQQPPAQDIRREARQMIGLLQLVVERGTGRSARLDGEPAAGKTGTSQNYRDAWFVGFSEPLVAGVWVGNDDETPMKDVTGGELPARIWKRFMSEAVAGMRQQRPPEEGTVPEAVAAGEAESTAVACNVRACSRAYRSFRASDCTYQPYRGQRKLCER